MKKIFAIILMLAILCIGFAAVAESTTGSTIEVLEITYSNIMNVPFEGGYIGFCITHDQPGASEGDLYDVAGTTGKIKNGNEDVSNIVKALLVECVDDFMTEQSDGVYKIKSASARENLYATIRWITGGYDEENTTMSSTIKGYIERAVARAEAETIQDIHVETFTYGPISYNVTFDFRVFLTRNPSTEYMQGQQNYFGFKVSSAAAAANSTPLPTITPTPAVTPTPTSTTTTPDPEATPTPTSTTTTPDPEVTTSPSSTVTVTPNPEVTPTVSATPDPGVNVPQTGDGAHIGLWIALLAVSGAAMFLCRRKSA